MRAVIDTNVLISGLVTPGGTPGQILGRLEYFTMVSAETLVAELSRVLRYKHIAVKYALSEEEIGAYLTRIRTYSEHFDFAFPTESVSRDPDDDKFLACAIAGSADFVVSGDRHLLELGAHCGVHIVTPAEFLALLDTADIGE